MRDYPPKSQDIVKPVAPGIVFYLDEPNAITTLLIIQSSFLFTILVLLIRLYYEDLQRT